MTQTTTTVGRRGTIVLPANMRRRLGLDEGALVVVEEQGGGILLRPAVARAVRIYTPEQRAEFLLNNSIGWDDYMAVREAVREFGVDPDAVPHDKPPRPKTKAKRA
jgi:AbrB family looped-hinge helix DNA binding protein